MYKPITPQFIGRKILSHIDFLPVLQRIDWRYFFYAWRLTGNYKGLETLCDCEACKVQWLLRFSPEEKEKANEAYQLMKDAKEILRKGIVEKIFDLSAILLFAKAHSQGEGILLTDKEGKELYLPMLRQQHPSERNGYCLSMTDFISPKEDFIGLFAVSVHGGDEWAERVRTEGDDYTSLLIKSVADRLAEATAEWLHEEIRSNYWGYAKTTGAEGIRPAFGYPSLPDLSLLFEANKLLHLEDIGIFISENGAMKPNATICGLHISHPEATYFMIGKIGADQKEDYAKRRGLSTTELGKWLVNN
ncbi:MAG: 5-methyltetrahydrofolate--homocysteine methyltransferase [Paludibacteraceae bacterium]|nr:5-methyltetrahydrofolate--homocysteine methyltransferase [Paludibacteraceae bacterium]